MDRKTKRKLKFLGFILGLFIFQIILLALINIPWITYYEDDEVTSMKEDMMYFAYTHQNPDSGLFIEPNIDSSFRAFDSINPNDIIGTPPIRLLHPNLNPELDGDKVDFFFDYLVEKQDHNGSFSDVNGLGNMHDTYKVVKTIDNLKSYFIDLKPLTIHGILYYLKRSLAENGYGFTNNVYTPIPDIVSTYYAINLANRFNAPQIHDNTNLSLYINTTLYSLLLAPPGNTSPELTYYGINAYIEKGLVIDTVLNTTIKAYFALRYNPLEGGYSLTPGGISDVQSTFYAISSLYSINATPTNENKSLQYILNCDKYDGGFGLTPYSNSSSDFVSGWAAMKSIFLLQDNNATLKNVKTWDYRYKYYDWLYEHQGMNGLIGQTSIQYNYLGALSVYLVEPDDLADEIDIDNIWDYVEDCYNDDGGFGSRPETNSSLYSTYCAIQLYEIFFSYEEIELPDKEDTIEFLEDLQKLEGGFEIGIDVEEFLYLFGYIGEMFISLIENDEATMESTFWAVSSLEILEALDQINMDNLMSWIRSCQNADGGFSVFLGYHSDTISTYFGLKTFSVLKSMPMSIIAVVEFLKNAQKEDGSFTPIPALSQLFRLPTNFLITYFAAKGLYEFEYQPEEIEELIDWYEACLSSNTGGVGDYPAFGGDLRNLPYGILLIEELKYDQDFNPKPWNDMITAIFILEMLILLLLGFMRIMSLLNVSISKKLKEKYVIGEKLNISYLQKFPAILCDNVNVYAGRKLIVDSVSMQLEHGKILTVLGSSGAGKSTFVKSLLGMRKFTGKIRIYGMNVKRKHKKMRPIYGYVPQSLMIYNKFTVLQNIMYFGKQYDLPEKEIMQKAKRILRALEIEEKMHEKVKDLSGGQKRRVSIAIALIHDPLLVYMDEPTSGLDPIVRETLWHSIIRLNEHFNCTFIIVTHYPEESKFCHQVAIFGRNRGMIDYGRPKDLLAQLPGKGRTIDLSFKDVQENAVERLESIEGIDKALENKVGTDFSILTDLNTRTLVDRIEIEFGFDAIENVKQRDSRMEEYFRYRAMEVPVIE